MNRPHAMKTVLGLIAGLALSAPLALGQGQIDTGRANDASSRVGSGGRNATGLISGGNNTNYIYNNGNRVVTGNVTMGREFRDNIGYTDPTAFRGTTAGSVSDNFVKNSAGVATAGTTQVIPNQSTTFFGASQTVAPPPGYQLAPSRGAYVPPPAPGQRSLADQRLGVVDLNQPLSNVPVPGELMVRGSLNPQQAAQQAGILTGSTLYGVREWNPADPADRQFLENLLSRQSGAFNRTQLDPREIQKMRSELEKSLDPQPQQQPLGTPKASDALNIGTIKNSVDAPANPAIIQGAVNDQIKNQPLSASGVNTEQGVRFNVIGAAQKTSTQYTELQKRLDQYYADRRKTDADFARDFNSDLKAKKEAEAKAAAIAKAKIPGTPDSTNPVKPPVTPAEDPTKPKVKKPTPVKITTLSQGVKGEGLSNVLKRAEVLMKDGKFASALDQYDAAEAVTPNNPLIWLGRANAELGAGFFVRADAHLRQAISADKALLMGQYDLTLALGEDRVAKIVTELKDIANKDTKPTAVFLLAYIAYNTGHEKQALGYLDLAEKRAGDDTAFYKMLREHWALPDGAAKPELNK